MPFLGPFPDALWYSRAAPPCFPLPHAIQLPPPCRPHSELAGDREGGAGVGTPM
jgi:hypothetical protein